MTNTRVMILAALWAGLVLPSSAAVLKIGTGSTVITPFLNEPMAGYYYPRTADGVHDDLRAKALVIESEADLIVLVSCDTVSIRRDVVLEARRRIGEELGIPENRILISATHSHTGPVLTDNYSKRLGRWIADSVKIAAGRSTGARLMVASESEASLPHYRRYLMEDGTVVTNPGFLNRSVVKPMGEPDPRVPILYAESLLGQPLATLWNYAMHPDTVGGSQISADYPYFLALLLSKVKSPNMLTVFTLGACGNINSWDVKRPGPQRGLDEARRLGEVLGGSVVKAFTHLDPVKETRIGAASVILQLPSRTYTAEELERSQRVLAKPPEIGVDFTLERVEASRIVSLHERGDKFIEAEIQTFAVGQVAFVGIPGELFVELGVEIQRRSPFPQTFVVTLANGSIGYIPTREAYEQGAYEVTSTRLARGAGERIVEQAVALLKQLHRVE